MTTLHSKDWTVHDTNRMHKAAKAAKQLQKHTCGLWHAARKIKSTSFKDGTETTDKWAS